MDPIGLVTVRERGYLLATRSGSDRTYRLSRVLSAAELAEPAERPRDVDLVRAWRERCARFLADGHLTVSVRVSPARREELLGMAVAVWAAEVAERDGWLLLEVTFQDLRHAEWALWQLCAEVEAIEPEVLREKFRDRAAAIAARYEGSG
ncbi:WYL domain-containing protein [Amycolatopsis pretoriensis]|uniref:WYL domain-containing protein n=1 Tax=Amycolatopsis pretoriensis TaxID=218821 RepID=A0A1H5RHY0_9PSEU|nr:WYL domain-containing protein [Amycolatopsis pretoriensis]